MGNNFTLFQQGGGSGSGSSEYTKDAFSDISIPANTNSGFSSTVSTNPLSKYFANDDQPRYLVKTLFVKDLSLIEDRSQWINSKPTYEIIWNETCPAVKGYVYGNVKLKHGTNGRCVEIRNVDDGAGITGVIRQVAWIVNPTIAATGTADLLTDGADTGNDATFGAMSLFSQQNGVNQYAAFLHNSSKESYNIHDYQLRANETGTLTLSGVVAYFENATNNIDCFAGSTYVDKEKQTSLATALAIPTTTHNGGLAVIYKDSNGVYQTSVNAAPTVESIGTGSINTNLLSTSLGHGASFPIGSGVVCAAGTSLYFGVVRNQSTDTLTVSPTLAFGLSGLLYKYFLSGTTQTISSNSYSLMASLKPQLLNNFYDPNGFAISSAGNYEYSEPNGKYRAWGSGLQSTSVDNNAGVTFQGATTGFLQIDGQFSAMDLEFMGSGINNHTVYANGITLFVINEGQTGMIKKTVFTDGGPGFNSVVIAPGTSLGNCVLSSINLYEMKPPVGISFGKISQFPIYSDTVTRAAENATIMSLGNNNRVFADQLGLYGSWVRGLSTGVAGGVYYTGASTNSVLKFQYYGSNFALIGTVGNSTVLTLDGASFSSGFNAYNSGISLGWHTIQITNQGTSGTIINALDYMGPTVGELKSLQNYLPSPELDDSPKVYVQSDTPKANKNGDIWIQQFANQTYPAQAWLALNGIWNKISFSQWSDDPNAVKIMVRSHGSNAGSTDGAQLNVEQFNFVSWSTGTPDTTARQFIGTSDVGYNSRLYVIDGMPTGAGAAGLYMAAYNKVSWNTSLSQRATATQAYSAGVLLNTLYLAKGTTTNNESGATNKLDAFNGTSWVNALATFANTRANPGGFVESAKFRCLTGATSAGAATSDHETWNGASIGSDTAVPTTSTGGNGGMTAPNQYGFFTLYSSNVATGESFKWALSSWSAAIQIGVQVIANNNRASGPAVAYDGLGNNGYINGGGASGTSIASTYKFNGASVSASTASSTARCGAAGGSV